MQRIKHADRKQRTRALILIGAAAERAGATDLLPEEIEAVLAHYVQTGGEPSLRKFVAKRRSGVGTSLDGDDTRARREAGGVGPRVELVGPDR